MDYDKSIFVPLQKYDPFQGIAVGYAATQARDADGERMHYERSKPQFSSWSERVFKASQGKNLGNVREMHNPHTSAGKLTDLTFDDVNQGVFVTAKIIDPIAKQKMYEGLYTGFSIGGKYADRWVEKGEKWYIPRLAEISIVDLANNPESDFQMVKQDGSTELRKFAGKGTEEPILLGKAEMDRFCGKCGKELADGKCASCAGEPGEKCGGCGKALVDGKCASCGKAAKEAVDGTPGKDSVEKGVRYLVPPDHLPVTDEGGSPSHSHMGAAWAALHGGYRGNKYEGPDKDKAIASLRRLYEQEGMEVPSAEKLAASEGLWKTLSSLEEGDVSGIPNALDELERLAGGLAMEKDVTLDKAARKSIHEKIAKLREHVDAHHERHLAFHKGVHSHLDGIAKVIGGGPESTQDDKGFEPTPANPESAAPAAKEVKAEDVAKMVRDGIAEGLKAIVKGISGPGDRGTAQPFAKSAVTKEADTKDSKTEPVELAKADYVNAMAAPQSAAAAKVLAEQAKSWQPYTPARLLRTWYATRKAE
jgi:hypothetical protein